ncbi:methyltransferase domain-containing protein [Salinisphaera sp. T31B1]|uniref:class I SAM-dependent methyltransferase n=1 Tax=Salinisphaera sp. T31B1 TaxID=727963 RepID=UPI00333E49CF
MGLGADPDADIVFDGRRLPLASGSVDAVVITHGLEQVADPHALLRDCARVLSERGQLVALVFNPLSLWALRQGLPSRRSTRFQPCSAPPSAGRLSDWMRLLEFCPEQLWRYGLGFPVFGRGFRVGREHRWMQSIAWCSQAYLMTARRQVSPRTPVAGSLRKRRRLPAAALARSSHRGVTCRR